MTEPIPTPEGETPPPEIVDSHCHLDFPDFVGDLAQVIARARAAGVTRMVTVCTRLADEPAVRALAAAHPGVFYAAGVHPLRAHEEPPVTAEALAALARHPQFVAIGETGLDFHYSAATARAQEESLRVHIEAARQTGLPLVIHARDADAAMARILAEEHRAGPFRAVMHCFTSGPALAEAALDLGFYLSMSGIAAFPKSSGLRAIFAAAPPERILVETDAPYLAPPPHRGRRNEPAFTVHTARAGAELFGMDYAAFARLTSANFNRLFSRAAAAAAGREAAA
jgi:TatD DNase family protein